MLIIGSKVQRSPQGAGANLEAARGRAGERDHRGEARQIDPGGAQQKDSRDAADTR